MLSFCKSCISITANSLCKSSEYVIRFSSLSLGLELKYALTSPVESAYNTSTSVGYS